MLAVRYDIYIYIYVICWLTVKPSVKPLGRYLGQLHPAHIISQYFLYIYIYISPRTVLKSSFHLFLGLESSHCPLDFTIKFYKNLSF